MDAMEQAALALCEQIDGAKFAYIQSDEISVLFTDFDTIHTETWFSGNVQKIASISASIATAAFNYTRGHQGHVYQQAVMAHFDARVFTIPDPIEVENYFIARQMDATRNSVNMAAASVISHKELEGVGTNQRQELLFQKGINWDTYPTRCKRGSSIKRFIVPACEAEPRTYTNKQGQVIEIQNDADRSEWRIVAETPIFTRERQYLQDVVPRYSIEAAAS
jgi:tRNA(His) 5'-end guanylyltransferase